MVDWDLFVHLAEIAGVFVGFGALIAVRGEHAGDPHTFEYLRAVVGGGVLVVITALAPLVVSRFDVDGRALWLPCSLFFLAVFLTFWVVDARSPENRVDRRANRALTVRYAAVALPMTVLMLGSLVIVVIGAWPRYEPALYFLAVTLWLVETGLSLLWLVWNREGAPQPTERAPATPAVPGADSASAAPAGPDAGAAERDDTGSVTR